MLDLELLRTLVCVVDEGSFTRAASRVHRTQSTVSQQVRKLEQAVGKTLLLRDRTGSNVSATEDARCWRMRAACWRSLMRRSKYCRRRARRECCGWVCRKISTLRA